MIKRILTFSALSLMAGVLHAAPSIRFVNISTNTLTRQTGTTVVAGVDVSTITASSATITSENVGTANITTANLTNLSVTNAPTLSSATITTLNVSTMSWNANATIQLLSLQTFTISNSSSTTSTTFVPTGLKITLTPKSARSRFEISVVGSIGANNVVNTTPVATLYRNASDLGAGSGFGFCEIDVTASPANQVRVPCSFTILDAPATTSSITYEVYIRCNGAGTTTFGLTGEFITVKEWSY